MVKDHLGTELKVGDKVFASFKLWGDYLYTTIGVVKLMTEKSIVIKYTRSGNEVERRLLNTRNCLKLS